MRPLFGLHNQQLSELLHEFSVPAFRVGQLSQALYRNWTEDLADVTNLPKDLRDRLTQVGYHIGLPSIAETYQSVDGTERYLIATGDGQTVETVWMPEGDDGETVAEQAREWKIAVEQAENVAKLAGKLPAGVWVPDQGVAPYRGRG